MKVFSTKKKLIFVIIMIFFGWFTYKKFSSPSHPLATAQPVGVATALLADVPEYYPSIGTVVPFNSVIVQSRVDGFLTAVHFTEGSDVKEGDLLVEIDPRPFEIQLKQAEAALARDMAILKEAKLDLVRYRRLIKEESVSLQQLQAKESLVGQYEAAIMSDKASIADTKLQLTYSKVTAPISGKLGLKTVDIGNMIRSSDTDGIVRITQSDPSYVVFTLVEKRIPDFLDAMSAGRGGTPSKLLQGNATQQMLDSTKEKKGLLVEAWDQQNSRLLAKGNLVTLDNQIDAATGTVKAKAIFDNAEGKLFPNQFVNVRLLLRTQKDALVIPTAAVQRSNNGFFVFVVNSDAQEGAEVSEKKLAETSREKEKSSTKQFYHGKASLRTIHVGYSTDMLTVIADGINPGDIVVTDGVDQLREGTPVSYTLSES